MYYVSHITYRSFDFTFLLSQQSLQHITCYRFIHPYSSLFLLILYLLFPIFFFLCLCCCVVMSLYCTVSWITNYKLRIVFVDFLLFPHFVNSFDILYCAIQSICILFYTLHSTFYILYFFCFIFISLPSLNISMFYLSLSLYFLCSSRSSG